MFSKYSYVSTVIYYFLEYIYLQSFIYIFTHFYTAHSCRCFGNIGEINSVIQKRFIGLRSINLVEFHPEFSQRRGNSDYFCYNSGNFQITADKNGSMAASPF